MGLIIALVSTLLLLFEVVLIARGALDWSAVFAGPAMRGSVRGRLTATAHALTEPVLAPVRRVLPPLRMGSLAVDLAFLLVFVGVLVLRQIVLFL